MKKKLKTIDLFAGIGGIRIGFQKAGFKNVFSNDFDKYCKITYDLNTDTPKLYIGDIAKIKTSDIPNFDFLLAGFPCQAFSIAGYGYGFNDPKGRGNLFFEIARILKDKQPMGFLLENVKNLASHDNKRTLSVILQTLSELGYHYKFDILNTKDYGNIPQNRERIYIVGFKSKKLMDNFEFPDPTSLTTKVEDLLDEKVNNKYYYNNKPLYEKLKNDVIEYGKVYQWRRKYVRENKNGVCPTMTANMGTGGHNVPIIIDGIGIRKLTPRECARIQGYSDNFILPENLPDSTLYKQIGNSVSVPVIERIAENVAKVINGEIIIKNRYRQNKKISELENPQLSISNSI